MAAAESVPEESGTLVMYAAAVEPVQDITIEYPTVLFSEEINTQSEVPVEAAGSMELTQEIEPLAIRSSEVEEDMGSAGTLIEPVSVKKNDEAFTRNSSLDKGGNRHGRGVEGNEIPANGNLIDLDSRDGGIRINGNGRSNLRLSSSWVSDFVMELGGGADRKENSGIEITLPPPENQLRPQGRWGR